MTKGSTRKKKGEEMRLWLKRLSGKKIIVTDITSFAALSFVSFQNAKRLFKASEKIEDLALRLSLQVLSMEELSKPLIIYEMVPPLGEKSSLEDEEIDGFINRFYYHLIKQQTLSRYGETYGRLGYKHKLSPKEVSRLEIIKQRGFYADIDNKKGRVHIPYGISSKDQALSKKISNLLTEKIISLGEIYHHPLSALEYFLTHSILQKWQISAQMVVFLETANFKNIKNFQDLVDYIEKYEQTPRDGELYVDKDHPHAEEITLFLLIQQVIKKKPSPVSVVGVSVFDEGKKELLSKNYKIFKKLIISEITKEYVQKSLANRVSYTNLKYKEDYNLWTLIKGFLNRLISINQK